MKKGSKRTLIFASIVAAVFAISLSCYFISRNFSTEYKNNDRQRETLEQGIAAEVAEQNAIIDTEMAKPVDERDQAKIDAANEELARLRLPQQPYITKMNQANTTYKAFAITSYVASIGGLAAFGICLGISDHIKKKEEDAAGRS